MQHEEAHREKRSRAKGLWRKKYECRRNKGNHTYKLAIPKWVSHYKRPNLTPQAYYEEEERKEEQWRKDNPEKVARGVGFLTAKNLRWYTCTACGHEEMQWIPRKNKRLEGRIIG